MKKILLTVVIVMALNTNSLVAEDNYGFYFGLGYGYTNIDLEISAINESKQKILDASTDSIVLQAGYDFNKYFGLESRYYINTSSLAFKYQFANNDLFGEYKAESLVFYIKPQYNFGFFSIYSLLGATYNDYTINNILGAEDGILFSWGGGAKFNLTSTMGIFVDYTNLGESNNKINTNLTSLNMGLSFKF